MALKLERMVADSLASGKNAFLQPPGKLQVVNKKLEDLMQTYDIRAHSVDTIISEPIGVLLVHERMLESFVMARDHYLKPGGNIFPTTGTIFLAPFSDMSLYAETCTKARFWQQDNFYGIDFSSMSETAFKELFGSPVVGSFGTHSLLAPATSACTTLDFRTVTCEELQTITVPIEWCIQKTGIIHGIAGWFDCSFLADRYMPDDSSVESEDATMNAEPLPIILSTHPREPLTHWQQIRFLFRDPLAVNAGDMVKGEMTLKTNEMRSYGVKAKVQVLGSSNAMREGSWDLHEQTYNYSYNASSVQNQPVQVLEQWAGLYAPSSQQQ